MEKQNANKLSEKAFSRMILTSVLSIVLCLVCLCSMTWAWFSDNVAFENNEIKTASECLLTVTVKDKDGNTPESAESGVILEQGTTYVVTLSLPSDSASGYCVITSLSATYLTDYIERHEGETPRTVTFELTVEVSQAVTFTTHWGIYSGESDVVDGKLKIK